jgi:nucleoside permease NupC
MYHLYFDLIILKFCKKIKVAGSTLAAYISFDVPANHLIVASIMAAPGALALSKTIYPETKKTKADFDSIKNLPKGLHLTLFI